MCRAVISSALSYQEDVLYNKIEQQLVSLHRKDIWNGEDGRASGRQVKVTIYIR
jgi:hypothetical protein